MLLAAREAAGRDPSPSAGVIDNQLVRTTAADGPRGYNAGKKVKGRKRHILTDTVGLLVAAIVQTAHAIKFSMTVPRRAEFPYWTPHPTVLCVLPEQQPLPRTGGRRLVTKNEAQTPFPH